MDNWEWLAPTIGAIVSILVAIGGAIVSFRISSNANDNSEKLLRVSNEIEKSRINHGRLQEAYLHVIEMSSQMSTTDLGRMDPAQVARFVSQIEVLASREVKAKWNLWWAATREFASLEQLRDTPGRPIVMPNDIREASNKKDLAYAELIIQIRSELDEV